MRFHRAINILTLAAFLPLAVGCSTQKAVTPETDPAVPAEVTPDEAFLLSSQVRIEGYTTNSDGFREWQGFVQAAAPDSLEFFEQTRSANAPPIAGSSFRLQRADVVSLRVPPPDDNAVAIVVVGLCLIVAFVVAWAANPPCIGPCPNG
jgi:hypothetical protein